MLMKNGLLFMVLIVTMFFFIIHGCGSTVTADQRALWSWQPRLISSASLLTAAGSLCFVLRAQYCYPPFAFRSSVSEFWLLWAGLHNLLSTVPWACGDAGWNQPCPSPWDHKDFVWLFPIFYHRIAGGNYVSSITPYNWTGLLWYLRAVNSWERVWVMYSCAHSYFCVSFPSWIFYMFPTFEQYKLTNKRNI